MARHNLKMWSFSSAIVLTFLHPATVAAEYKGKVTVVTHRHIGFVLTPVVSEWATGTLQVVGLSVKYAESNHPNENFSLSCDDFAARVSTDKSGFQLRVKFSPKKLYVFYIDENIGEKSYGHEVRSLRDGIITDCIAARDEPAREADAARAKASRDAAERKRDEEERENRRIREAEGRRASEEMIAQRAQNLREGLLTAWRAIDDPEPFKTIRGEYDLASADSRHWKTSLHLPGAEDCFLLRITSAETPVWTFVCQFRPSADFGSYEYIVEAVKSALGFAYQPDDSVENANQVHFADSHKPLWRLVVTKLADPSRVLLWITPQVSASGPSSTPLNPIAPVSDSTIRGEIEKVRGGKYTPLPPIQATGTGASRNGMAVFEVKNDTAYALTALFSGPTERSVEVAPGTSISVELPLGAYKLVGRVNAPDVLPSYGEHTFEQGSSGLRFFLQ